MRHTARAGVVAIGACLLLSGCFGSGSSKPTAADTDSPAASPTGTPTGTSTDGSRATPTSPATSEPTTAPTSSAAATPAVLTFSPKSDGRHSHTCFAISGTAPVDYIYYPVMVTSSAPVTLDSAAVTYADGVQVAGSWVAPVGSTTGGVGTVEGWPAPAILAQSSSVQWNKRVPASGATLDPATGRYTVFLHLRVYPDALPLHTDGVVLTYHQSGDPQTVTWVDHLAFKTAC